MTNEEEILNFIREFEEFYDLWVEKGNMKPLNTNEEFVLKLYHHFKIYQKIKKREK